MENFQNSSGKVVVEAMIATIKDNCAYLSEIDGAIGDGDHGINMNKGFTMCREELDKTPGDLAYSLKPCILFSKDLELLKIASRAAKEDILITADYTVRT